MEPDVIRIYASSPPPMEDEEEDDEFGDFGTFSGGVPNSISFTEFDTPTTFNQAQALTATSPPELLNGRGVVAFSHSAANGTSRHIGELSKANGVAPAGCLGNSPSERTDAKKLLSDPSDFTAVESVDCNGGGTEVLTNGFDVQGSPSSQNSVHSHTKGTSTEDTGSFPVGSPEDDFADFAAFPNAETRLSQTENEDSDSPRLLAESACGDEQCSTEQGMSTEDNVRDTNRTGPDTAGSDSGSVPVDEPGAPSTRERDSCTHADIHQRDALASEAVCTKEPPTLNGLAGAERDAAAENDFSPEPAADDEAGPSDGKGSEPETETETSLGLPLSTDALEEFGDMSTTGSLTSPPLPDDTATPADHSQLVVEDEDFGDFGDAASFSGQGFADFGQAEEERGGLTTSGPAEEERGKLTTSGPAEEEERGGLTTSGPAEEERGGLTTSGPAEEEERGGLTTSGPAEEERGGLTTSGPAEEERGGLTTSGPAEEEERGGLTTSGPAEEAADVDDDFGDFNSPKLHGGGAAEEGEGTFAAFPVSDSFGNFSSAVEGSESEAGWNAFGEPEQQAEGESWAAFGVEQSAWSREEEWEESEPPACGEQTSRTENQSVSLGRLENDHCLVALCGRLERLFHSSFPHAVGARAAEEEVVSLKILLEPPEEKPHSGSEDGRPPCSGAAWRGGVWTQLQDIHEALGLRYQWGGSHCNKVLLCCLGIDTRNILFTGQKKQPVIVPMYAAGLGMLEPTKEPVKPVSAAEMIASIAQAPPGAPDKSACSSDAVQEALPPVQFDWSSSGLTNPLDASGGSSLLNLDFFGPVEDSGSSSSTSIPGVDPELYELTTAKLDPGGSSSRVADAFARLMSTMEKTSTSTRKPRKDENLSEEAAKVIAALPDLSFMQAKVLMFPATLTPLGCQAMPN